MNRDGEYEAQLVALIKESFTTNELGHELYFPLSITFDDVEGTTRSAKAQGLVQYCGRNGRLPELVALCQRTRPNVSWPSAPVPKASKVPNSLKEVPNIVWVLLGAIVVGLIWLGSAWPFGDDEPLPLPTNTPTVTATEVEIVIIPSDTPSPTPTATATEPFATPTRMVMDTSTPTLTSTPTSTSTPTPTPTPTATETVMPSVTPTSSPTPTRNPYEPPNNPVLGDSWRRSTDEMQMFFVPSGTYWMGSQLNTPNSNEDENPQHEVALTAFWMDYAEVTTTQFAMFLNVVGNQKERGVKWVDLYNSSSSITNDNGEFFPKPGMDDKPVTLVSWYGAEAYCQWAGGQLPTESQWEYAARGENHSTYPWGNASPTCDLTQFRVCPDGLLSVGSKSPAGDSWVGLADMGGNAWEWTADWYDAYETAVSINPTGPRTGSERVLRGGSWGGDAWMARTAYRYRNVPTFRSVFYGFRCATPHLSQLLEDGNE